MLAEPERLMSPCRTSGLDGHNPCHRAGRRRPAPTGAVGACRGESAPVGDGWRIALASHARGRGFEPLIAHSPDRSPSVP